MDSRAVLLWVPSPGSAKARRVRANRQLTWVRFFLALCFLRRGYIGGCDCRPLRVQQTRRRDANPNPQPVPLSEHAGDRRVIDLDIPVYIDTMIQPSACERPSRMGR